MDARPVGGKPASVPELSVLPLLVSARSVVALRGQAERLAAHLLANPEAGSGGCGVFVGDGSLAAGASCGGPCWGS